MVFDDEFSTVTFMREGTILPNRTDLVQRSSQSGVSENVDLKYTWFAPYIEEYPIKTPSCDPSVASDNNNEMIMLLQYKPHAQEIPASKGSLVTALIECPAYTGVWNT